MTAPEHDLLSAVSIRADADLVWHAWTRPERVTAWFAPEAVVEPRVGGAFELYFIPGNRSSMNTRGCRITALAPPAPAAPGVLEFTWRAPDEFAELMNGPDELTHVRVLVSSEDDGGAQVEVTHSGFGHSAAWQQARAWHAMAWDQALGSLKQALETGAGELCCLPD